MYIQRQLFFRRTACLLHWLLLASMVLALLPATAGATPLVSATPSTATPPLSATAAPTSALQEVNTLFWPNRGHFDPAVQYELRTAAGLLLFAPDAITFAAQETRVTPIHLRFTGANPNPVVEGVAQSGVRLHSYLGNDPSQWSVDQALHKAIRYRQLYPGIDLHYDTSAGLLKGTYFVDSGVDPTQIRWRYEGARQVVIDDETGDLVISLAADNQSTEPQGDSITQSSNHPITLIEKAPVAWQEINGQRVPVPVTFQIQNPKLVLEGSKIQNYQLVIGGGEMVRAPKSFSGTSGVVRFDQPAATVFDTVMRQGLEHHFCLTYGDCRAELRTFAGLVGLPILELT